MAPCIACHTRSGVAGIGTSLTPRARSASTMALITVGVAPTVPDSPAPFTPIGLLRQRSGRSYCSHPVVRTHPATGRKALYVNRLMAVAIEGMDEAESDELRNLLFDHQEQRQFVYEHVWGVGDILMWDNHCTLHARTDFSSAERRLMRRVTILGEKPV